VPHLPGGLTVRPLTADDLPAAAGLLAAAEPVDDTGEHSDADDLAEWWVDDLVDLPRDSRAVWTDDGALVAVAVVVSMREVREDHRVLLEGRVHPAWRGHGIGRALLDWQLRRGAEVHRRDHPELPGRLDVSVYPGMGSLESLVRRAGFTAERWYADMVRPLTGLAEAPAVPGVELVPFAWNRDDEVRRVHNAAFTDHHGSAERDATTWRAWFTGTRAFRPDLSVLALVDGAVAGYVLTYVYEADTRGDRRPAGPSRAARRAAPGPRARHRVVPDRRGAARGRRRRLRHRGAAGRHREPDRGVRAVPAAGVHTGAHPRPVGLHPPPGGVSRADDAGLRGWPCSIGPADDGR
jgi:GNAT superfamily N-acetyltransferase